VVTTEADGPEASEGPFAFAVRTVNVYAVAAVSWYIVEKYGHVHAVEGPRLETLDKIATLPFKGVVMRPL
jgi:hypothetical protein